MEIKRDIFRNYLDENLYIKRLFQPHIESFDHFLDSLSKTAAKIQPIEFEINDNKYKIFYEDAEIAFPSKNTAHSLYTFPRECRVMGTSYSGKLMCHIGWLLNGEYQGKISKVLGNVPIMIRSKRCVTQDYSPSDLIACGEEANEQGGYFICNGIERVLRLIIVQRRNYPLAITRPNWKNKVPGLTEQGVSARCVDSLNNCVTNTLHYSMNSTFSLSLSYKKQQYFIPFVVALKLLVNYSDYQIYCDITSNSYDNVHWSESTKSMLSAAHSLKIKSRTDAQIHIGESFRIKLGLPTWYSNLQVAEFLVNNCICIHLNKKVDKYNFLVFMAHKLIALIDEKIGLESPDVLNNQEVLTAGQIYQMVLIDKLENWLISFKHRLLAQLKLEKNKSIPSQTTINCAISRCPDVGKQMEYFIKSGNIITKSGIGLPQMSGFTIVADKLNYVRYLSHFRSVHRGVFFTQSYSVQVRKLLPECWGFLCPVHTPDGAPCGLLNHMTHLCQITTKNVLIEPYDKVLCDFGIFSYNIGVDLSNYLSVLFDGKIAGYVNMEHAELLANRLIHAKIKNNDAIEIVLIKRESVNYLFPGLFIFTTPCRFSRPVYNLTFQTVENIGVFEQIYLNICLNEKDITPEYTHIEINPAVVLSVTAALIPFSECNQSPRNMYQCQMIKQSMGIPAISIKNRFDNKLYWLYSVQSPICQNKIYQKVCIDDNPVGLNAVVAVISYTGYDMEDAMILNKSSVERGFASGCVYKSVAIDLNDLNKDRDQNLMFACDINDSLIRNGHLQSDGLPPLGRFISKGEIFFSYVDMHTGIYSTTAYKFSDGGYIDGVAILSSNSCGINKVNIRIRIPRNPIVGDKFSSRHGQKGVLSYAWPIEDMPFTESGMIPDLIFNPHGFPSRMTIGMLIETMASKEGAISGTFYDGSPFKHQDMDLVDYFGEKLSNVGFNYYGTETMYSGVNGEVIEARIFTGIVYYQRLRHMVSDKFQVRSTGAVDLLTHQPVGGRKRGGGVRFGEMERDCLISHGCSFLLQDRLFGNSDKSLAFICELCGDLLATKLDPNRSYDSQHQKLLNTKKNPQQYVCMLCNSNAHIKAIYIPYVFRYLAVELASMNIQLKLNF